MIRWQKDALLEDKSILVPNSAMGLIVVPVELAIMPPADFYPGTRLCCNRNVGGPFRRSIPQLTIQSDRQTLASIVAILRRSINAQKFSSIPADSYGYRGR